MKRTLLLISGLLLFSACNSPAVDELYGMAVEIDADIDLYEYTQSDLFESTEGGTRETYEWKGETLKIVDEHFGEMGRTVYVFYFSDGELFYAEETAYSYAEPIYINPDVEVIEVVKNEYYMDGDELIVWLKNDELYTDAAFIEKKEEFLLEVIE